MGGNRLVTPGISLSDAYPSNLPCDDFNEKCYRINSYGFSETSILRKVANWKTGNHEGSWKHDLALQSLTLHFINNLHDLLTGANIKDHIATDYRSYLIMYNCVQGEDSTHFGIIRPNANGDIIIISARCPHRWRWTERRNKETASWQDPRDCGDSWSGWSELLRSKD